VRFEERPLKRGEIEGIKADSRASGAHIGLPRAFRAALSKENRAFSFELAAFS
jgi:hypothetical protein